MSIAFEFDHRKYGATTGSRQVHGLSVSIVMTAEASSSSLSSSSYSALNERSEFKDQTYACHSSLELVPCGCAWIDQVKVLVGGKHDIHRVLHRI